MNRATFYVVLYVPQNSKNLNNELSELIDYLTIDNK